MCVCFGNTAELDFKIHSEDENCGVVFIYCGIMIVWSGKLWHSGTMSIWDQYLSVDLSTFL